MHMNIRKSALLGAALLSPAMAALAKQRPNIIFFLVDDYGWVDSSVAYGEEVYPGNLHFHTPNMERLARKGVILTSAYACPVSTPTRTAMMSGMNAIHSHITNWVSMEGNQPSDAVGGKNGAAVYEELETDIFRRPDWNINGLCPDGPLSEGVNDVQTATPMVRLLRDAGYYTIHVGKAHWASAGTPGASPYNMGFLVNVAGTNAGGFYDPGGMGDGSIPDSLVVVDGQIYYMEYGCGIEGGGGIAALDGEHKLHVARSMTRQELIDNDIRYAVCYGPVLIVNGVSVSPDSLNVSLNPRTAIGQCADGAILLLVIDGRQVVSMGAKYQDLVEIMERYGAVNAVNLDGGSSSMLWFQDHYVNNSSSGIGVRDMPTSFVVLKEGANNG